MCQRINSDWSCFQGPLLQAVRPQVLKLCVSTRPIVPCRGLTKYCRAYDLFLVACIYKLAVFLDARITPEYVSLSSPYLYTFARVALWSLYGFANGLVGTGLWVLAHECGHQAFSESKALNNAVGWVLHSACVSSARVVQGSRTETRL